jgi:hypothetical protein
LPVWRGDRFGVGGLADNRPLAFVPCPGSGSPGDRKKPTQAPDRGRHPRGCRPRRRFLTVRSGRRLPEVAAGFQPAGSPGPGLCLCRLKTCTHFQAGCCEEVASHHIWVRQLRGSRRDAALAAVASSVWPSKSGPGTPRAIRANHGLHPTTHSPTKARARSRIGRARSMRPRMRSSITGLAA